MVLNSTFPFFFECKGLMVAKGRGVFVDRINQFLTKTYEYWPSNLDVNAVVVINNVRVKANTTTLA